MPEADRVVQHVELAADLAEHVEERGHLRLVRAAHDDVPAGGKGRGGPRGGLDPVGQSRVREAPEPRDALDPDDPVGVDRDDRAHLLQDVDQVHDLGLDRGVRQLGDPVGPHSCEQELLGRPDARVRQAHLGADQAVRRAQRDALLELVHLGAELPQDVEVVVDRPVADPAATEVGDEGLAQAVQQRAAEQDRDPARPGVRVDVGHVGVLDVARVEGERAVVGTDLDAVQLEELGDHGDVPDLRDVAQHARGVTEQGGDHRLGDEVLRSPHGDLAVQRDTAVDLEDVTHGPHRRAHRGETHAAASVSQWRSCARLVVRRASGGWRASADTALGGRKRRAQRCHRPGLVCGTRGRWGPVGSAGSRWRVRRVDGRWHGAVRVRGDARSGG